MNKYIRITVYPYVLEQFSTSPRRDRRRHTARRRRRRRTMRGGKREFNGGGGGGGGGGHRKKAKWFNHKGVRARATTNERGVFFMCAREKSAETGESDEKDDG